MENNNDDKPPSPDGITDGFYPTFKEERNVQFFANSCKKLKRKEYFPTHYMEPPLS